MDASDKGMNAGYALDALSRIVGLDAAHLSVLAAYGTRLFSRRATLAKQLYWFLLRQTRQHAELSSLSGQVDALLGALERMLRNPIGTEETVLALARRYGIGFDALGGLSECLIEHLVGEIGGLPEPRVVQDALEEALRKRLALDLLEQLQDNRLEAANGTAARMYAILNGVSLALINAQSREQLFGDICRICVEQGGFSHAWIGMVNAETRRIDPAGMAGDGADAFVPDLSIPLDCDAPSARAITTLEPQVVDDTLTDATLADWLPAVRSSRVRSMLVTPLKLHGAAIGTLVLYATRRAYFDQDIVGLVRAMARELSHALERHDALERSQKAEKDLAYLTRHDALTGLPNRQLMLARIGQMLDAAPPEARITLITLAVDGFHEFNARLGHASGDIVLREVALRMSQCGLASGAVGRVGAARFVAVDMSGLAVEQLVAALQEAMRDPIHCQGETVSLRCSLGVVHEACAGAEASALMRCADLALITAREAGGGRCRFYDEAMDVEIRRLHALRGEFSRALERNELELFYQPKINLIDHRISGVEALVRWRRDDGGHMAPGEFFPAIEHTDLMRELDWWVMGEALRHSSVWMAQGKLIPVSVNLSAMTLRHESFMPRIQALIMRHPIPDGHLELEVLETVSQKEAEEIIHKLESCRELGISIALDDFGTGASSLVHLQQLPFDTIKIDQRFVRKLLKAPGNEAIIRSMISFAHYTGRKLVVEGVESQPIWDRLLEIGCTAGQGYAISAPVSAPDLMAWIAERDETPV